MTKFCAFTLAIVFSWNCLANASFAAKFASAVVSYDSGTILAPEEIGDDPLYDNPLTALGSPDDLSGETGLNPFNFIFPNVLSSFSPPYEGDEIVEIGPGGQLTLRLSNFLLVGPGYDLGVFANVGLEGNFDDNTFEFMGAHDPATVLGAEAAVVEVSQDGQAWVALNGGTEILFDMPANYYQNAGAFDGAPPASPVLADFGQPIAPDLSVFDGQSEAGVLAALGGSAGGYWLDLSATGLTKVGYVRFSVPLSLLPDEPYSPSLLDTLVFELDAVALANGKVGGLVPEPSTALLTAMVTASAFVSRRFHRKT